jgi:hypothetical protein
MRRLDSHLVELFDQKFVMLKINLSTDFEKLLEDVEME